MEELIGGLLYTFISWCYMWIKYRNKEKARIVLKEKYNDSYQYTETQMCYIL